jgi:hypothetical protein
METDITSLLRSIDPVDRIALSSPGIDGAMDELGVAIPGSPARSRRTRLSRPFFALGLAAVVVVIGASVATAAMLGAHTGRTMPKAEVTIGGPGEELNPAAPDFRSVALQIAADIPYPDGYGKWRALVISDAIDPSGLVSSGALHGWFAMSAFCAWVRDGDRSVSTGDGPAASLAARTIAQAPGWKAVRDEDPHPDPAAANDPGAETGTLFGWLLPYRDAVLAGDRARVEHLLATGYGDGRCSLYDPVLPARQSARSKAARS